MIRMLMILFIVGGILFVAIRVLHLNVQQYIQGPLHTISGVVQPKGVGNVLGTTSQEGKNSLPSAITQTLQTVLGAVTGKGQDVHVDQVIQQVKQEAMSIPGTVLDQAKYAYCKQVVKDYESRK